LVGRIYINLYKSLLAIHLFGVSTKDSGYSLMDQDKVGRGRCEWKHGGYTARCVNIQHSDPSGTFTLLEGNYGISKIEMQCRNLSYQNRVVNNFSWLNPT